MALVKVLTGEVDSVELGVPTERLLIAGDVQFTPVADLTATDTQAAIVQANLFGSYDSYIEQWSEQSVSGSTITALTMSLTIPAGQYIVQWSYLATASGLLSGTNYNLSFDGVSIHSFTSPTGSYSSVSGFRRVTVATAKTLTGSITVQQGGVTGTAYIKQASLLVYRVA